MLALRDLADELLHAEVKAKLLGGDHTPQLGRLRILDRLGAGAMGTVFAAYDPRLDRKVAVKVLRTSDGAARVLAEARALAKLAHPNVVAVHDADELDGIVYIVMELAAGVPLRAWIAAPRDWREIVRVLRDAGAGIAAAHAAGLVHRDVKPDNILVGDDRARVVDFGLANPSGDSTTSAGTPFYMAPEVLSGSPATAASDQFSFGVTMYEALYGKRPYDLATSTTADTVPADAYARGHAELLAELRLAAAHAADAPRPPGTDVPAWLHAIVTRALAAEPTARFPSVAALVDALGRDRRRRNRFVAVGIACIAAGTIIGALGMHSRSDGDPCGGGPARTAEVWTPAVRQQIGAALGPVAWNAVTLTALDQHIDAWHTSYRRVCEATRVRGDQSDSLLDLRMRCLDRALDRFAALGATLTPAVNNAAPAAAPHASPLDLAARAAAPSAVAQLPTPAHCESLASAAELALPADPAERAKAAAIQRDIDRAWAAFVLGRYTDARTLLAPAGSALPSIKAPRLLAEERALASSIESRIGDPATARARLDQALLAAAEANAPELEYDVWTRRLRNELFGGDPAKVLEWETFARAAAKRANRDGAEIDGIVGEALRGAGKLAAAREHLTRALASNELRPDQRAIVEMNLGSVDLAEGNSGAAITLFARARDRVLSALGDHHPDLALYSDKLAAAHRGRGTIREALALHDRSLALRTSAFGRADRSVASSLLYRAQTRLEAGDLREARADIANAIKLREAIYGADSPRLGELFAARGDIAAAAGSHDEASGNYDRAAELDKRIDLTHRRLANGEALPLESIPPLTTDETPSVDRVVALATRVALLAAATRTQEATDLAALLRARLTPDSDPRLVHAIATALLASAERASAERASADRASAVSILTATAKALPNDPTRTALAIWIALAHATLPADGRAAVAEETKAAARTAIALYQAMPQLERGPVYDEMWTISRK